MARPTANSSPREDFARDQRRVWHLMERNGTLSAENEVLAERIRVFSATNRRLQDSVSVRHIREYVRSMSTRISNLCRGYRAQQDQLLASLGYVQEGARREVAAWAAEGQEMRQRNGQLEAEVWALRRSLGHAEAAQEELRNKCQEYKEDAEDMCRKYADLEADWTELDDANRDLATRRTDTYWIEAEMGALECENQTLRATVSNLQRGGWSRKWKAFSG